MDIVKRDKLCFNCLGYHSANHDIAATTAIAIIIPVCATMQHKQTVPLSPPPASDNAGRGHPFIISRNSLNIYRLYVPYLTDIALLLDVSRVTLFRRHLEYGLQDEPDTLLTDSELVAKASEIKEYTS